jgi:hypothetical protein
VCVFHYWIKIYICAFGPCCTPSVHIMWLCECACVLFHIAYSMCDKLWAANCGTRTAGGTESYLAIIFSFRNAILNTKKNNDRTLVIRIDLALRGNLSWILHNKFTLKLPDQVQYSVMASKTLNQAWSKCLDAGTYCK